MKLLKPSPTLGRNAFDLSYRNVFTANAGELLPCLCLETVPNDKVTFKVADLLRAAPMVTSPFLRCKQHIDFWFVPYSALWSRFNDFIVSRSEPNSAAFKDFKYVPHIKLSDLIHDIWSNRSGVFDVARQNYAINACRLLDLLGYPMEALYDALISGSEVEPSSPSLQVDVNLWRLAAYNLIWYKEYRQQYYDDGTFLLPQGGVSNLSPAMLFNFDDMACDTIANSDVAQYRSVALSAMTQMRYRLWKKDLYTGLLPSSQFGAISVVDGSSLISSMSPTGSDSTQNILSAYQQGQLVRGSLLNGAYNSQSSVSLIGSFSFDILSLRRSEAIQKWRENALRAGNQVEDNFESHFGSKPKSHMISHPTFIGSYDSALNISDVNATASTGNDENGFVGDVAGKGISSLDEKELTFQTNDFGVIIGLFSLLPEADYLSVGIDRPNQLLEQFDYFSPEMENLGLEAVPYSVFDVNHSSQVRIPGYAPRYYGYKTKLDKVHLGFYPDQPYHHWVTPRADILTMRSSSALTLDQLYVNPSLLDTVFVSGTENEPQFIVDLFNDVTAIRSMSVTGMPSY